MCIQRLMVRMGQSLAVEYGIMLLFWSKITEYLDLFCPVFLFSERIEFWQQNLDIFN